MHFCVKSIRQDKRWGMTKMRCKSKAFLKCWRQDIVLRNYISRQEREGWPWIIFDKITQIVHRNWEKQAEGFSWKHTETPTGKVLYHMTTNHSLWVDSSPHFICIKSRAKIWHDTPLQQVCSRTEQKDSITCSKFVFNKEKKITFLSLRLQKYDKTYVL